MYFPYKPMKENFTTEQLRVLGQEAKEPPPPPPLPRDNPEVIIRKLLRGESAMLYGGRIWIHRLWHAQHAFAVALDNEPPVIVRSVALRKACAEAEDKAYELSQQPRKDNSANMYARLLSLPAGGRMISIDGVMVWLKHDGFTYWVEGESTYDLLKAVHRLHAQRSRLWGEVTNVQPTAA